MSMVIEETSDNFPKVTVTITLDINNATEAVVLWNMLNTCGANGSEWEIWDEWMYKHQIPRPNK